ncbi:ubiquinone biosynthesis accessory factor UbiJ [Bibersteinia trehalosi]|uniref:ubiquinone biosynthesis accessory factor UbiJ n=1 Tax=Bibersteinia trehalosi TaxID=47735 RepID=UPI002D7887D4|nr:SCP2 sterol-binding domain-containing protein [Bibersteinia trehalosi]
MLPQLKQQLMLPQFAIAGLETALNGLIKRSPHILPILRKLAGKNLQICLKQPDLTLFAFFSEQRIDWLGSYDGEIDCQVNLDAAALPKLADKSRLTELINNQTLVLHGDLQVLQHFTALLDSLEKNPAELLSPLLGDVVAQASTDFAKGLLGKLKTQIQVNSANIVDNLMVERPVLVHRLQVVDFCDQVQELAQQAVELEQKMANLSK